MKRIFLVGLSAILVILLLAGCGCDHMYTSSVTKKATYNEQGEMTYVCSQCGDTYTEPIERHVVSRTILDESLSNIKYRSSIFTISIGKLVNSAMSDYKIEYFTGEEAIEKGYLSESDIDSSIDINYLYYAIISGETMQNPDVPYMTTYEEEAVIAWLLFDENDQLKNSGVALCGNLQTCAILLMSSSY